MAELFRDTVAGDLIRLLTRRRFLKHTEEADPTVWDLYVEEKGCVNSNIPSDNLTQLLLLTETKVGSPHVTRPVGTNSIDKTIRC